MYKMRKLYYVVFIMCRHCFLTGNASSESVIRHYANLHTNIVRLRDDDVIEVIVEKPKATPQGAQDTLMINAATQIMLASYRFATIQISEENVIKII